jgi:hypothetical protein
MAKTLIAFMERSQVPSRQALQEAVKNLRFRLSLDEAYVPFEWAGYLPCTLDGEDASVDIRFADSASRLSEQPKLLLQIGNRGTAILLRGGGDPREQASALILGAVLAHSFGALVQHHGDDSLCAAEQLLEEARAAFSQMQEG